MSHYVFRSLYLIIEEFREGAKKKKGGGGGGGGGCAKRYGSSRDTVEFSRKNMFRV